MTPQVIFGGSYVDATARGAYAALLVGAGFDTYFGPIDLPPGESWGLHYVRCCNFEIVEGQLAPGFAFAGQAHSMPDRVWEWTTRTGWRAIDGPTGGIIYQADSRLLTAPIQLPDGSYSSAGYRYVADDGHVVLGQDTYVLELAPGLYLHEWSETHGVKIGQGHDGGAVVWDGAVLRSLIPAPVRCFYIRVQHVGDSIAISVWLPDRTVVDGVEWVPGAYIYQTTLAELLALPPIGGVDRDPIPPPAPPPHNPNPDPGSPIPAPRPPSPTRPTPPVQPAPPFPAARPSGVHTMRVFLKRHGKYVGNQPDTTSVYADRDKGGGWEEVALEPRDGGLFVATFAASGLVLSGQPDGRLETRPAGTDGPYELWRATSQPEGLDILYREDGGQVLGEPLTIEAIA